MDPGVCFAADLVTRAAREVASAPPSADLPLPEASGSSSVSGPVLAGIGIDGQDRSWSLEGTPGYPLEFTDERGAHQGPRCALIG